MQNSYILLFSNYGQTWPNRVYIHKHKQKVNPSKVLG